MCKICVSDHVSVFLCKFDIILVIYLLVPLSLSNESVGVGTQGFSIIPAWWHFDKTCIIKHMQLFYNVYIFIVNVVFLFFHFK